MLINDSRVEFQEREPLDISAEAWFLNPNVYDEKTIEDFYNEQIETLKRQKEIYRSRAVFTSNKINSCKINMNTRDTSRRNTQEELESLTVSYNKLCQQIKDCDKMIKKLINDCIKQKKELKKENKKIAEFKQFRTTYKLVQLAIESIGDDFPAANRTFLNDYRICAKRVNAGGKNYGNLKKEFINKAKVNFKKAGFDFNKYLPKESIFRKFFGFFGTDYGNIRESVSGKNYDSVEREEDSVLNEWIEGLGEDTQVKDVFFPGSHDAGSYSMRPLSSKDIIGKMAYTQSGNILAQLKSGIRVFDWRMKQKGNILVFVHGPVTGTNVLEGVRHICKFLDTHSRELIILKMHNGVSRSCIDKFRNDKYVREHLLGRIYYPRTQADRNQLQQNAGMVGNNSADRLIRETKIKDITRSGKNVLIFYSEDIKGFAIENPLNNSWNPKVRKCGNNDKMLRGEMEQVVGNVDLREQGQGQLVSFTPVNTGSCKALFRYLMGDRDSHAIPMEESARNFPGNARRILDIFRGNQDEILRMYNGNSAKARAFLVKLNNSDIRKRYPNVMAYDNVTKKEIQEITRLIIAINQDINS